MALKIQRSLYEATDRSTVTSSIPEPVLRTERVMRELPVGETPTVLSTDPASVIDFTYYCQRAGLELLSVAKEPGLFTF